MKFMYPDLIEVIDLSSKYIPSLVIESSDFLNELLTDLYAQLNGSKGKAVLSKDDKPIDIAKKMEIIDNYFTFDINQKTLINKILKRVSSLALAGETYSDTMQFLGEVEQKLYQWAFEAPGDIVLDSLTPEALLKAAGLSLSNDYSSKPEIAEKFIDYMELVREYDTNKVFVFLNMRSYFNDTIMQLFINSIISHDLMAILIDNKEYPMLNNESRITIDSEMCVF